MDPLLLTLLLTIAVEGRVQLDRDMLRVIGGPSESAQNRSGPKFTLFNKGPNFTPTRDGPNFTSITDDPKTELVTGGPNFISITDSPKKSLLKEATNFTPTRDDPKTEPVTDGPRFISLLDYPEYGDGTLDYAYLTKSREPEQQPPQREPPEVGEEKEKTGTIAANSQVGSFGENSGNMSNNTNSNNTNSTTNNTTNNNYKEGERRLKDDVPLGAMQAPANNSSTNNVNSTTDASHHKGDTSTFVTNNFYNPPNKDGDSLAAVGGQLEFEYLWKRIYDLDGKLSELSPIVSKEVKGPLKRKGLIITFDPETDPGSRTLSLESDGIPNDL